MLPRVAKCMIQSGRMATTDRLLPAAGRFVRVAGLCGVASPFVALGLIAASVAHCLSFSWFDNYLSVLGVEPSSQALFHASLIAGATLDGVFAVGLWRVLGAGRTLVRLGVFGLLLGACALCAIALFPRTAGMPHDVASVGFFTLVPLSLLVIGIGEFVFFRAWRAVLTIACGLLLVILQLIPWPWGDGAISQFVAGIPFSLWLIASGTQLLLSPPVPLPRRCGDPSATEQPSPRVTA